MGPFGKDFYAEKKIIAPNTNKRFPLNKKCKSLPGFTSKWKLSQNIIVKSITNAVSNLNYKIQVSFTFIKLLLVLDSNFLFASYCSPKDILKVSERNFYKLVSIVPYEVNHSNYFVLDLNTF